MIVHSARLMLQTGHGAQIAKRYLSVLNRRKLLRKHQRAPLGAPRDDMHPLILSGFRAPLSLAGCRSLVIVHGEALANKGIPLAFELDPKGRHRGMPVSWAQRALHKQTGEHYKDLDVLAVYGNLMVRYVKIRALLNKSRDERDSLELLLFEKLKSLDPHRFRIQVESDALVAALSDIGRTKYLVVGYSGGDTIRLSGDADQQRSVVLLSGAGSGLVVVRTQDVRAILGEPGDMVSLDFDLENWSGYTFPGVPGDPRWKNAELPITFRYFGGANA